jgi:hypothetical protein
MVDALPVDSDSFEADELGLKEVPGSVLVGFGVACMKGPLSKVFEQFLSIGPSSWFLSARDVCFMGPWEGDEDDLAVSELGRSIVAGGQEAIFVGEAFDLMYVWILVSLLSGFCFVIRTSSCAATLVAPGLDAGSGREFSVFVGVGSSDAVGCWTIVLPEGCGSTFVDWLDCRVAWSLGLNDRDNLWPK